MGRYATYDSYDDPDAPKWWHKALAVIILCGLVRVLLWWAG